MNTENFPTSESAKRMMGYITGNEFYGKSYVGKWIFQVMGKEMDDAHLRIEEELPYQAFPETATWGLRYHEEKHGLPVRENLSYEERRRLILEKRNTRAPMNPYRIEKILENIIGRKVHVNDEDTPIYILAVEIEPGDNAVDVVAAIKKLKEIKQSHAAFTFSFTSLSKIDICGHTQKWKTSYIQCGTTPIVSNGLGLGKTGIDVVPSTDYYKMEAPITGEIHKSGQYPITSVGMELADNNIDVSVEGRGLSVVYPNTGERVKTGIYPNTQAIARYSSVEIDAEAEGEGHIYHSKLTGTDPKVSVRSAESDNGVIPEVSTEAYQVRYKLCGDAFEI